jgi:hypothetical protein
MRGPLGYCTWDHYLGYNRADLEGIHRYCIQHREQIERSAQCACFYCLAVFAPAEITDWVDLPEGEEEERGVTALCPRCGIDAVLPDNVPGAPLSVELLSVMRQYWFDKSVRVK